MHLARLIGSLRGLTLLRYGHCSRVQWEKLGQLEVKMTFAVVRANYILAAAFTFKRTFICFSRGQGPPRWVPTCSALLHAFTTPRVRECSSFLPVILDVLWPFQ